MTTLPRFDYHRSSKKDREFRNPRTMHIVCAGLTKRRGRAEARREYDHWVQLKGKMVDFLRARHRRPEARALNHGMRFSGPEAHPLYVHVNGDVYDIFRSALRAVDAETYYRWRKRRDLGESLEDVGNRSVIVWSYDGPRADIQEAIDDGHM